MAWACLWMKQLDDGLWQKGDLLYSSQDTTIILGARQNN